MSEIDRQSEVEARATDKRINLIWQAIEASEKRINRCYGAIGVIVIGLVLLFIMVGNALADPYIVDPNTGQYLGTLNSNPYDPQSVSNPYGQYGSPYGNTINNPYGEYGSPYSTDSWTNPYSTGGPVVIDPGGYPGGYDYGYDY